MMTTPKLRRIERRPLLSESVQVELKSYILEHGLRSGDPLPSASELAKQLGVSRNSVREAVKSLETLGLIQARVGSGLYVGSLSLEPVLESLLFGIASQLEEFSKAIDARMYGARMYLELGMIDRIVEDPQTSRFEICRRSSSNGGMRPRRGATRPRSTGHSTNCSVARFGTASSLAS